MLKNKINRSIPLLITLTIFVSMAMFSSSAIEGAGVGLELCLRVIIPTLLPFFMLSNLLCSLGLPSYLNRLTEPFSRKLFGVGGNGMTAFLLAITGGYPLGASSVAEMYKSKIISKNEAVKLLRFCNNTGPAFIIGMAGAGIFHSPAVGIMLYIVHVFSAVLVGMILCKGEEKSTRQNITVSAMKISPAITYAMQRAVSSTAMISGFIIFFSMLTTVMQEMGVFTILVGFLTEKTGLSIGQSSSLVLGIMELGSGIANLDGLPADAENIALASFILGWGGISVHFQTAAVLADTDLHFGGSVFGKFIHGIFSAVGAYFGAMIFFV